jgi:D-beta-D-heptose 7-phosphate kinase/D-beta-D-heptose 1-phosphate adenosyltransferase
MELLAGLRMVDCVVSFDAPTPARLIARLKPDVLVKGRDYRKRDIVGHDGVIGAGGRVVTVPLRRAQSTSRLIKRALAWKRGRGARRRPGRSR